MTTKNLCRIPNRSVVGGVAAGFANYFGVDVALMRIIFAALFIFGKGFPMFIIYIILWAALPKADWSYESSDWSGSNNDAMQPKPDAGRNAQLIGYGLVIVGGYMIFDKMFYWIHLGRYVPAMLFIGIGSYLIFRETQTSTPTATSFDEPIYSAPDTNETPTSVSVTEPLENSKENTGEEPALDTNPKP
jgi:phage shock protein C